MSEDITLAEEVRRATLGNDDLAERVAALEQERAEDYKIVAGYLATIRDLRAAIRELEQVYDDDTIERDRHHRRE